MSSVCSSSNSSRSSTDDSQVGLLKEKCEYQDKAWQEPLAIQVAIAKPCRVLRCTGRLLAQAIFLLIPSFLHRRQRMDDGKVDRLAPTAFLDGMRGLAAFAVFICHLAYGTFDIVHAYGAEAEEKQTPKTYMELMRLPIVRLLYSGPPNVALFFVISGYCLSYKPIKQMRSRQHDQLMTTITSSVFRRGFRLFLPCFASTFIVICLAQLNLYKVTEDFSEQMRMKVESHCYTQPNFWLQFKDWLVQMHLFVDVFDWSLFAGSIELDRHLWTIPVEFRCSLALFVTHVLTARMSGRLRILTLLALLIWGVSWDRWALCPLWAGAVIAELDIIWTSKIPSGLPSSTAEVTAGRPRSASKVLYWFLFVISLFLLSFPDTAADVTPGYITLDSLIPETFTEKHRFWPSIGACLIIWSACRLQVLRTQVFCWSPIQYLGKISFPLYVMHGPVIHTLGYMILPRTPTVETPEIMKQFEVDFAKAAIVIVGAVVWVADIFWRVVDTPCVNLTRRLEKMFLND